VNKVEFGAIYKNWRKPIEALLQNIPVESGEKNILLQNV